jgi:hypothetical protein
MVSLASARRWLSVQALLPKVSVATLPADDWEEVVVVSATGAPALAAVSAQAGYCEAPQCEQWRVRPAENLLPAEAKTMLAS